MIPAEEQAQRQAALRALLAKPLLVADADAESLVLVRRHLPALQRLAAPGDRLAAGRGRGDGPAVQDRPAGCPTRTHPARGHNKEPFGRRRYVTLCLALSALARADAQTTLGSLADDVLTAAAEPGLAATGFTLTLDSRSDRADLVAVVRLLLAWGVLSRVAGDEDAYLSAGADVLYDVRRPVLGVLLTGSRGPSTISRPRPFEARLAELTAEPVAETDELRNQALRRMLTRRLLDDPVVYYDELTEDERAYLVVPAARHHPADQRGHRADPRDARRGHRHGGPGRRAHRRADARAAHRRARHAAGRRVPGGPGAGAAGRAARVRPAGGAGARELLAQGRHRSRRGDRSCSRPRWRSSPRCASSRWTPRSRGTAPAP